MAMFSMALLIVGVGGILLGLGWALVDAPSWPNLKPAVAGALLVSSGLMVPLDGSEDRTLMMRNGDTQQPIPISSSSSVDDLQLAVWPTVSTRMQFACGTDRKGRPTCWGEPVAIGDTPTVQIALGRKHGCALRTTGQADCWGSARTHNQSLAQRRFTALASTLETTCGIATDGTIDCWGDELAAPPAGQRFTSISGGAHHFCAITTEGEAVCWGDNSEAQATPKPGPFTAVSAGHFHTCGIQKDSTVTCWGRNHEGQSTAPSTRFRQLSSGWAHTCGINQRGRLECWGCNSKSSAVALVPTDACRPPPGQFVALSSGDLWKSCAISAEGQSQCWGGLDYERGMQ